MRLDKEIIFKNFIFGKYILPTDFMNNKFYFPLLNLTRNESSFHKLYLKKGKEIFILNLWTTNQHTILLLEVKLLNLNLPGYTPSNGIEKLRLKISKYYSKKYKVDIHPDQIFITNGSSGAFLLTFISAFDSAKKVGIFNPVYPAYRNILKSLNIDVIEICSTNTDKSIINFKDIENFKFLDGLVISNPNNLISGFSKWIKIYL